MKKPSMADGNKAQLFFTIWTPKYLGERGDKGACIPSLFLLFMRPIQFSVKIKGIVMRS